jgi:membrane protease YdiL (CAAX protease family)
VSDPAIPDVPEPPLLAEFAARPPKRVPPLLALAAGLMLVLVVSVTLAASGRGPFAGNLAYRIGEVIGGAVIWPLIAVGLFSIGRRFRNNYSRVIILLVVWSLGLLGQLGELGTQRRQSEVAMRRPAGRAEVTAPAEAEDTDGAGEVEVTLPGASAAPVEYDFSAGSDQRLAKLIEHAQEETYHAVVAAYRARCAAQPADAVLALERVKFIERFADSEDFSIESAAGDLKAAVDYLTKYFPTAPGTVLYQLRNFTSAGFEARANSSADLVGSWPAPDRAQFFLLRARAANAKHDNAQTLIYATSSFAADATTDAGLLLAKAAHSAKKDPECLRALQNPVFDTAEPWIKKQKMELLFDLGETKAAVALFEELQAAKPAVVRDEETANHLAGAGRIAAARTLFTQIPVNRWNGDQLARARFEFELKYGTAGQADTAYRTLRAAGLRADPLLRHRLELFRKHPAVDWSAADLGGAIMLVLVLAIVALMPLGLLGPVHYWSLRRARRGRTGAWPGALWGLREAWVLLGMLIFAELLEIWLLQPGLVRSWWGANRPEPVMEKRDLLSGQWILWATLVATLLVLVWRARAWRLIGAGQWGVGKAIGVALGAALVLRLALGICIVVWPEGFRPELASLSPQTRDLCVELLTKFGPAGLIAIVAIFVPVFEEFMFRGVLLQAFARHLSFGWANAVQALLFASVHESLLLVPFFFSFGFVSGIMARRSGGLLASIVMHAANNLVVCVALLVTRHAAG